MGLFNMARICRHSTTTIHVAAHRRGGNHHDTLSGCARNIQGFVHSELDLEIFRNAILFRSDPSDRRDCSDDSLLRLFLGLLYQVSCAQNLM